MSNYNNRNQRNSNQKQSSTNGKDEAESSDFRKSSKPTSSNKRSKGNRNAERQGKPVAKRMDEVHTNDISWWNNSPQYVDATRVPFNRIAGSPIDYGKTIVNGTTTITIPSDAMPGIMVLNTLPTCGEATSADSPVNRAFTSLYGEIYSKTTGAMQFQQMDLALFVISMASIANLIAHCKRILGVSQFYHGQNYYYPEALLTALGVTPSEVIGNQDKLRAQLNNAILSFNGLKVPDILPLYIRQYSMFHSIFADEDSVLSQLYLFKPAYYYEYSDTLSQCTCKAISDFSFAGILGVITTLLNAWRNSSDLGLISGAIQRAFSDRSFLVLDYTLATDVVVPVVDRNIMWQINNASIVTPNISTFDMFQVPGTNRLVCQGMYDVEIDNDAVYFAFLSMGIKLLRSFDGSSDEEFVMEATRLMQRPVPLAWEEPLMKNGTEVITKMTLYTAERDAGDNLVLATNSIETSLYVLGYSASVTARSDYAKFIARLAKFKYAPPIYTAAGLTATTFNISPVSGDVYRYTTIDGETLDGLTTTALQSVYATDWQGLKPSNNIV